MKQLLAAADVQKKLIADKNLAIDQKRKEWQIQSDCTAEMQKERNEALRLAGVYKALLNRVYWFLVRIETKGGVHVLPPGLSEIIQAIGDVTDE